MKRNLFGTGDTLVVAASLAVVPVLGLIDSITPVQVENFIKAPIANYRPNVKTPKQVNASNVEVWVNGQISRILGLINSCPASVAGLYNFGLTPGRNNSATVNQLVDSIPLPKKPSTGFILVSFRVIMGFIVEDENGVFTLASEPLVFNELPLTFAGKTNLVTLGISPLEWELFSSKPKGKAGNALPGVEIKRQLDPSTQTSPNMKTKLRVMEEGELKDLLTPLEFASYRSAAKLGVKARFQELNDLALSRKSAKSSDSQAQVSTVEDDSSSLQEFASAAKASRKKGRPSSASRVGSPSVSKVPSRRASLSRGSDTNAENQQEVVTFQDPASARPVDDSTSSKPLPQAAPPHVKTLCNEL